MVRLRLFSIDLMNKNEIIFSGGSIPWIGIKQSLDYAKDAGYDGLEILPTRKVIKELENVIKVYGEDKWVNYFSNLNLIKGIHQNWRLDIGLDKEYKINFLWSLLYIIVRLLFFPKIDKSKKIIGIISEKLRLPVTVHEISNEWTHDDNEFSGGIFYEIISAKRTNPVEIKKWLRKKQHKIVVDTRDDQSILWAKNYGFKNWKSFWEWIGLQNIGGIQLTLIGTNELKKILKHTLSTAEEQFLWLQKQKWHGKITVEINPLMLFFVNKGRMKQGLQTIATFVRQTLGDGKNWSS